LREPVRGQETGGPDVIELRYDRDIDAAVFEAIGRVTVNEYEESLDRFVKQPFFRLNMNTIWDLRKAEAGQVTAQDVRSIVFRSKQSAVVRGSTWKTAIVVEGTLKYGLARMFEFFADGAPYQLAIFKTMEEAREWVKELN
jgi:hypothetical protein